MNARNISHFDIHADKVDRAKKFYGSVFGWRFTQWGPPDFHLIATGTTDDPGIHGAVHQRPAEGERSIGFQCTIAVDDIDAIAKLIENQGGSITVPRMTIPGVGDLIQFRDTEGNIACAMRYLDETHGGASRGEPVKLDHIILNVNDPKKSVDFYTQILGFTLEGEREPFTNIRVSLDFRIQLAPFGTKGGEHLAFRMSSDRFEGVFRRVRENGIEYGDAYDGVGNMRGPGVADGANGDWNAIYFFDPNQHLIEVAITANK